LRAYLQTSAAENLLSLYIIKDIILQHSHFYSLASFPYIKALVLPSLPYCITLV